MRRKPREIGSLDWDEKLTLEFVGEHPSLRSVEVKPAPPDTPVIYIAGDSTVTDQEHEPWAAWGQMLPAFFGPGIAVANNAESGETIRSFVGENRFPKIFSEIKRGDYLLMQFGHNDQKQGNGYVSPEQYADLLRKYIAMARQAGATPVLLTPMNRRTFDSRRSHQGHARALSRDGTQGRRSGKGRDHRPEQHEQDPLRGNRRAKLKVAVCLCGRKYVPGSAGGASRRYAFQRIWSMGIGSMRGLGV